ncbi:MAG: hypothetical protein WA659_00835 [Candidatus Aquirickettsiella sp.]
MKSDTTKFSTENLINVSTQNNFCGYYVLARRIINDANFAVILEKFNQFYQTNWYSEQLAEVMKNMHPEQAEIMLGLVIHDQFLDSSGDENGLLTEELKSICEAFGYDSSIFFTYYEGYADSIDSAFQDQSGHKKILILFDPPKGEDTLGHYSLIELDKEKVALDASLRDPSWEGHIYTINNEGGETQTFINNIKKSVAEIKPNWAFELKNKQIQQDEIVAWKLAAEEAHLAGLTFFTNKDIIKDEVKSRIIELQEIEFEYYKEKLTC